MKTFILYSLLLLLLCNILHSNNDRSDLIYKEISLDKQFGFNFDSLSERKFFIFYDSCIFKINELKKDTNLTPLQILKVTAKSLKEFGITNSDRRLGGGLITQALFDKKFDCGNYSAFYLSIAEKTKLPLFPIFAPGHVTLLWDNGKDHFIWEALYDAILTNEHYIKDHFIPQNSIEKGYYLTKKGNDELIDDYLNTISCIFIFQKHQYEKAIGILTKLIKSDFIDPSFYISIGLCYFNLNENDSALFYFNKALAMNNQYSIAYNNRGSLFLRNKEYEKALADYDSAIKYSYKYSMPYLNKSDLFYEIKNYDSCIKNIKLADSLCYLSESEFSSCAAKYYYLKKYDEAVHMFSKAIKINPKNPQNYLNRGVCEGLMEQKSLSLNDCQTALDIAPNDISLFKPAANIYYENDKYNEAADLYKKLIRLDSTNQEALFFGGYCLSNLKKYHEALILYEKLKSINPKYEGLKEALRDVKKKLKKK